MKNKSFTFLLHTFISIGLILSGCVARKASIKSYFNPSLNASKITSVAVFPMRNSFVQKDAGLGTGDVIEINAMIQKAFVTKNPQTIMVDAVSSTDLINKGSLVNSYDTLLRVYENTGLPNTMILNKIGEKLKIDAIIQGFVKDVFQQDGVYGRNGGETKITMKYVMFSTKTGDVLWEVTCQGYKRTATTFGKAPAVFEVIEIIQKKILTAIPALTQ
jgi:hypothetical protein